ATAARRFRRAHHGCRHAVRHLRARSVAGRKGHLSRAHRQDPLLRLQFAATRNIPLVHRHRADSKSARCAVHRNQAIKVVIAVSCYFTARSQLRGQAASAAMHMAGGYLLSTDFDRDIPRNRTNSVKHDGRAAYFGTADVLPLWVADMDFASPEAVTRALLERAAHPIYGYTRYPESAYEALIAWLKKRHGWEVQREWIVMAPGVVPTLFASVMAFSQEA